jgi:MFS family permease
MSEAPQHTGLTAVLRGSFGLLWAGQSVSMLGDGVFLVAFTWQLAVQWRQPALLGLLLAVRVMAELATLALGGWIVDRLRRRSIVLAADAGRALLLLGLAAALHRPPPVPALAALIVGYGVLTALFRPALVAYLPELVQSQRLAVANSLLVLSTQTSMVAGPALGAALVGRPRPPSLTSSRRGCSATASARSWSAATTRRPGCACWPTPRTCCPTPPR